MPTAEEIVGGPRMMPRQRTLKPRLKPRLTPRRQYQRREAELERAVIEYFAGAGHLVWSQVDCGFAGFADVVTEDAIYELKDWVTRRTLYQAVGQLTGYRNYLNPALRPYIICNGTNLSVRKLQKFETLHGISILVWGPPYAAATRPISSSHTSPRRSGGIAI
jgi:hypothetical protein